MQATIPYLLVFVSLLTAAASARAQLVLDTDNLLAAPASTVAYKTTLVPGRYSAVVRSSAIRPAIELADDTGNVLIVRESGSRSLPAAVEMNFIVARAGLFVVRVRAASGENDGRFHLAITRIPEAAAAIDNPPAESSIATDIEQQVVDLVNQERRKADLPPLRISARLAQVARQHSANMAKQNVGNHELDGIGPGERVRATGYRAVQWAENIAWGARTPQEAMLGWMNSPGHRRNILSSDVSEIGVGMAESSGGVLYWTQVFGRAGE